MELYNKWIYQGIYSSNSNGGNCKNCKHNINIKNKIIAKVIGRFKMIYKNKCEHCDIF